MKMLTLALLAISLAPAVVLAQASAQPDSLRVPGTMTPSGHRFASTCTDTAFAQASDAQALARHCQSLLARWQGEAELALARRSNPRVRALATRAAATDANLPFDTVATLRAMPLQMSHGR